MLSNLENFVDMMHQLTTVFSLSMIFIYFSVCLSTEDGLRQAKANPDRDVEHKRGPSFKLFTDKVQHDVAETKCEEWGGKLASLNTVAKIQFVSGMLEDGVKVWIGAKCV